MAKILGWRRPGKIVRRQHKVSDFIAEGPPVPIPNTEVKLCYGKDTWLETAWENSSSLTLPMQPKVALFAFTGYRDAFIPP